MTIFFQFKNTKINTRYMRLNSLQNIINEN
jgi:hypothetical protein